MQQGRAAGLWRMVGTPRRCLDIQVPGERQGERSGSGDEGSKCHRPAGRLEQGSPKGTCAAWGVRSLVVWKCDARVPVSIRVSAFQTW